MGKRIRGYPDYDIDKKGNVRNKYGKCLKPGKTHKGYLCVYLYDKSHKRKGFSVHRLVAETFIPNPKHLKEINHKDGNKENNCIENLEWCTGSENVRHSIKIGTHYIPYGQKYRLGTHQTDEEKRKRAESLKKIILCENTGEIFKGTKEVMEHFGLTKGQVGNNLVGRTKLAAGKYKFSYVEV